MKDPKTVLKKKNKTKERNAKNKTDNTRIK